MAGLARHKASVSWQRALSTDDGRFIPNMEKFISEGLYLDHPPAANEADGRDDYRPAAEYLPEEEPHA
jgi:hypothetical protein